MKTSTSITFAGAALVLAAAITFNYLPESASTAEPPVAAALAGVDIQVSPLQETVPDVDSLAFIPLLDPRYRHSTD